MSNSFTSMVYNLETIPTTRQLVNCERYNEWKKQWIFDAIKGYRLGQSFCEYFDISNASPLYYFKDNTFSDRWIKDNYLIG